MTHKEAGAPAAKQIVRFQPIICITSDDLRQIAAQIDGDVAEVNAYRTKVGTRGEDEDARVRTLGWATRLREIAAEVERVSTDPETGIVRSGLLLWLHSKKTEVEVAMIMSEYGIALFDEAYDRMVNGQK